MFVVQMPSKPRKPRPFFYALYEKTEKVLGRPEIDDLQPPCVIPNKERTWEDIVFPATRGCSFLMAATGHATEAEAQAAIDEWVRKKGASIPKLGTREAPGMVEKRAREE